MKTKAIFVGAVVFVILILVLFKVVEFSWVWENAIPIGTVLIAIYAWITGEKVKAENQALKKRLDSQETFMRDMNVSVKAHDTDLGFLKRHN